MFDSIDRETERTLRSRIDRDELESHVDALADLRRYPGSDDQWAAAEYVMDALAEYGVDATLHTFEAYTSVPEDASVTVTAPRRDRIDDAITTAFSANTPPGGVTGELVAVDAVERGRLATADGRIVLVPGLPTPGKVQTLEAAGAEGVVFESPTPGYLHEMIVSPVWGTPGDGDLERLPDLPVVEVHQRDAEWLRDLATGDDATVTLRTETRTGLTELPCPVARVDGSASDRYVLLGNHIDSWHEGVTDNATAVAASLELARVLSEAEPKRGLVVGFWPGHSMGRYAGSAWYADRHWLDLRENGVAYLHVDLNGLDGADRLWFQHMAEVEEEHLDALRTGSLPLGTGGSDDLLGDSDRPGRNSDQSFWGAGLSSLLSGARFGPDHEDAGPVGGGWWWHTPADTRDKVDPDLLVEEVELYVTILSRFCFSPVLPHDLRRTCEEIREGVSAIDPGVAAVDFAPVYEELDDLADGLAAVSDRLDAVDTDSTGVATDLEDLQVALLNQLIPAAYMGVPEYEHEPALGHEQFPGLRVASEIPDRTGRNRRAAEISATRAVNRLAHRLRRANEAIGRTLSDA